MEIIKKKLIKKDPKLELIFEKVGECTIGKSKQHIFSYFIGVIIGQKIRFKDAQKLRSLLYTKTGNYNFTPSDIKNVNWDEIPISDNVVETIKRVTDFFIDKDIKEVNNETFKKLLNIKGIGEWTVFTTMIQYGFDYNLFPLNDVFVNKRIKRIYGDVELDNLFELWSPYKSVVFWYLQKYF